MNSLHVLIADDDANNLEVAMVILSQAGYHVTTCVNGAEVLDLCLVQRQRFDILFLDIQMPQVDGLEACQRLRSHPDTADIPIVCVSARASATDKAAGAAAGCNFYVTKPYKRQQLLDVVDQVLTRRGV